MSLKFVPFVIQTVPENSATDVPLDTPITVLFNTDLDPASLEGNFIVQTAAGGQHVAGAVGYANRTVTFTPAAALEPGTAYIVIIKGDTDFEDGRVVGVRSILQYPMAGVYTVVFTTTASAALSAPHLKAPLGVAVAADGLVLSWNVVSGAAFYEAEISADPNFSAVLWKKTITATATEVIPDVALVEGNFFWRVRALDNIGNAGLWSQPASFAVGRSPSTALQHIPGELYHPLDPPAPYLELPTQVFGVDPGLTEIVVAVPHVYSAEHITVQMVGTSFDGNVHNDHGIVPIEFVAEAAPFGIRLRITLPQEE